MALKLGIALSESLNPFLGEESLESENRVKSGCGVSLGEDKAVSVFILGI